MYISTIYFSLFIPRIYEGLVISAISYLIYCVLSIYLKKKSIIIEYVILLITFYFIVSLTFYGFGPEVYLSIPIVALIHLGIVLLIYLIMSRILNKFPVYIAVLVLLLTLFFYPKPNDTFDMYAPDDYNLRCSCVGFKLRSYGIDSSWNNCYGITHSCKKVPKMKIEVDVN